MTRILITGTSHAAALKAAWQAMIDRPVGVEVDFFATIEGHFGQFTMAADGRYGILEDSSATEEQVDLVRQFNGSTFRRMSDYTHVVISGCSLGYAQRLELLAQYQIDLIRETSAALPRLSKAAYAEFSDSLAWKRLHANRIQQFVPWGKVALMASPRYSEAYLSQVRAEPYIKALAADPAGLNAALALADDGLDRAITGLGLRFMRVPDSSLAENGFTHSRFARDGARIRIGKPPDNMHMNADYGALCLAQVFDWVAAG